MHGFRMCYKRTFAIISLFLVFLAAVKGSCLEYGHSCWGAHGKRSGSGGKQLHVNTNRQNDELKMLTKNDAAAAANELGSYSEKIPFEALDELASSDENPAPPASHATGSAEDSTIDLKDDSNSKLRSFLRKHSQQLRNKMKLHDLKAEDKERERLEVQNKERWHKLPLLNLKSFRKPNLNREENDLLQKLENQVAAKVGEHDESAYYDFN